MNLTSQQLREIVHGLYRIASTGARTDRAVNIRDVISPELQKPTKEFVSAVYGGLAVLRSEGGVTEDLLTHEVQHWAKSKKERPCMVKTCKGKAIGNYRMCEYHRKAAQDVADVW